ncbi:MAG: hypothetical protein PWP51_2997 [Clostridiales bacterium]|jgi:hypothetical protein|nr:hypothetical protein [Clostridiales bacterium]MDN5300444.1 hypothetical protein [Clostridiales bacterium]
MKKGDAIWAMGLLAWAIVLLVPVTRNGFMAITGAHPYAGGFFKFAILAMMGDLLGERILHGEWHMPKGAGYRILIWGIVGMMVTLSFTLYMGGAAVAQASGRLPFPNSSLALAFFGSFTMNVTFGPMMMVFQRFSGLYIDLKYEKKGQKITINELIDRNDWHSLVGFNWLITCPFLWIPLHTLVFLMPSEYRVLASAFLSVIFGFLMAIAKKKSSNEIVVSNE